MYIPIVSCKRHDSEYFFIFQPISQSIFVLAPGKLICITLASFALLCNVFCFRALAL